MVEDGPTALAVLCEASRRDRPFAVVLIDANMPVMDGFQLAERIKNGEGRHGKIVMMLSSNALMVDITRCQQLGIAAYVTKPIRPRELCDRLLTTLDEGRASEPTSSPKFASLPHGRDRAARELKIMVADDNPFNRKVASLMLEKMGHTLVVVNDGKAAVARLADEAFDLVFMDVQMPGMDGLEATAAIRAAEEKSGRHTPVIALTAFAMKGDLERFLEAGFDGYVAKPIQSVDLSLAIDRLLATVDRRLAKK
jgi:CheY-like chemotaxis protein